MSFTADQIARLTASGWVTCSAVAVAVVAAGLPAPTGSYLGRAFTAGQWGAAERAVEGLRSRFAAARFAGAAEWGLLLVPDPGRLDTRRPMALGVRKGQFGHPAADVFDSRLPAGVLAVPGDMPWTMVATVTGPCGPALGSYHDVTRAPAADFTVAEADARVLMTRQIWGARVLQRGTRSPTVS